MIVFQGSLPIALIFDYPESDIDPDLINKIMYTFDVFIAVRQKSRQSTLCVVIKGIEKYITNIYEARHQLLKLSGPRLIADIPSTYFFSNEGTKDHKIQSVAAILQNEVTSRQMSSLPLSIWSSPPQSCAMESGFRRFPFPYKNITPNNSSSMPDISRDVLEINKMLSANKLGNPISPKNNSDIQSSGYHSMNCSILSLENPNLESENEEVPNLWKKRRSVDIPSRDSSYLNDSFAYNFDPRVVSGYNAMNIPPKGETRTPKIGWQGLGLSQTMPAPLNLNLSSNLSWMECNANQKFNATTSLIDSASLGQRQRLMQYNDVTSILTGLGLEHHIRKLNTFKI